MSIICNDIQMGLTEVEKCAVFKSCTSQTEIHSELG